MTDLLFVYGTLLQPGNLYARYLKQNCTYLSAGKVRGLLYDVGEYPGAIVDTECTNYFYGSIFKLHQTDRDLQVIDEYEDYGPTQDQPNLYVRQLVLVETDNSVLTAWVYLYNLPVIELKQITSGDYSRYLEQKKSPGS